MLDRYGKFLTLNKNSEARYFIIHTDRSLNEFASLYAEDIKDPDIINLINAVNHRTKIPFFGFKKESWNFEFSRWTEHFYSPNLITGKERYYWAIA